MTHSTATSRQRVLGGLWGSLVGDALGVPVEFEDRSVLRADPVEGPRSFGTHHQPAGTWSDDGALILCTVDSLLAHEFDPQDMGGRFVEWVRRGLWTAGGMAFDVGMATSDALHRIERGVPAENAGGCAEYDNGNGSLMRILPVALRFAARETPLLFSHVERASAITHGHVRSKRACAFFAAVVRALLRGEAPSGAVDRARAEFRAHYGQGPDLAPFERVLNGDLAATAEGDVASSGYVLHTLHASLWCLLTTSSYRECVLRAVNLGGDTDTTACVAGGLAGVYYGLNGIPDEWRTGLLRQGDLNELLERFANALRAPATR